MSADTPAPDAPIAVFIRSLSGRGAERSMINLAQALTARGYAVDLVLAQATGALMREAPSAARIVDLGVRSAAGVLRLAFRAPSDFAALAPLVLGGRPPVALGAIDPLTRYLRDRRPLALLSALDHPNLVAAIAAKQAGVGTRVVLSQRSNMSSTILNARGGRKRRLAAAAKRFYPRADAIVAVSDGVARDLVRALDLPPDLVRTIYNPVVDDDLTVKAKQSVAHPWFDRGPAPLILGVGALRPQKDFGTLIRAFAAVQRTRDARLVILGEGPERGALEALARSLGVAADVSLPGYSENPFACMARADLFVLSSLFEGLPGVLIQALACGCPVVSTDCPSGPAEILEGGRHGPLVPIGDEAAMAAAMARTLDSPPDRESLRRRGAFFSFERAADAYLDVLLGPQAASART